MAKSKGYTVSAVVEGVIRRWMAEYSEAAHLMDQYEIAQGHLSDKGFRGLIESKEQMHRYIAGQEGK